MKMRMALIDSGEWWASVEENHISGNALNLDKDQALIDAIQAQIETERAFSAFNKFTDRLFVSHKTTVFGKGEENNYEQRKDN